ncbi:MAG: CAP domain-containing protein [Candidatus Binataceae bacterium]
MRLLKCILLLMFVSLATGCIEWTTNSQGNLNSIGLPGLPVWKSATASNAERRIVTPTVEPSESSELIADVEPPPPWLDDLNKWRQMAGLKPVGANSELIYESQQHAIYLIEQGPTDERQFRIYAATIGGAAHRENPHSPWYTKEGALGAAGGPLTRGVRQAADVSWGTKDPAADIDGWITVPFHRLSLLAPWAEVAGYGSYGRAPRRASALAFRGRASLDTATAVEFPPNGANMAGEMMINEWPNPLAGCSGYALPVGLPITLQLGGHRAAGLEDYSLEDQTEHHKLAACAFDGATYRNPDRAVEHHARNILDDYGAVVLIPREPLRRGHRYEVSIQARGHSFDWRFGAPQDIDLTTRR